MYRSAVKVLAVNFVNFLNGLGSVKNSSVAAAVHLFRKEPEHPLHQITRHDVARVPCCILHACNFLESKNASENLLQIEKLKAFTFRFRK